MDQSSNKYPSLKQLYPSLSGEELRVAQENIDCYLQVILRICKRLESADQRRIHNDLKA